MRTVLVALALLCGVASADDKPWAKDVPQAKQDKAFALYEEANKLFADGEYKRALDKYESAITQWDHPSIRYNLAVCLINLDRPVDAYENLTQALRYGEAPLGHDLYNEGLNYQKLLSKQVAEIEVASKDPDARVSLDGKPLTLVDGHAQAMVAVNESHEVIASKPGYQTMRRPLDKLPAGQKTTIEIKLSPLETGRWKPWAVIAGGAIVAGAGAYVYGLARSNIADYEKAVETKCPCASDADLGGDADLPDRARTKEIAAYSMFALGGVTIATGIVLVVRGRGHTSVAPAVTKDSAGISLSGAW
jgi:tetratricopeptide (TPR) repeat protein